MTAELAKLRYLQFPRWTAVAVVGLALLVGAALLVFQPKSDTTYEVVPSLAVGLSYGIAGILLGVWMATLEFTSGTLQRTLTADPNRSRVLGVKVVLLIGVVVVIGIFALGTSVGLSDIAASRAGVEFDHGKVTAAMFSIIPSAAAAAILGFGFGLLTRSMGGGITAAFAVVFVLDGALSFAPVIGDWTFGELSTDLQNGLSGEGDTTHGLPVAAAGTLLWLTALTLPGWLSFTRGDLK